METPLASPYDTHLPRPMTQAITQALTQALTHHA